MTDRMWANGHDSPNRAPTAEAAVSLIQHCAQIPLEAAGRRLDQALAAMFPQYSRSRLSTWIRQGSVRLDGALAAPRQRVCGGETVDLRAAAEHQVALAPQPIDLDIRYQDAHLLVINKPAGLVVHPGAGNPSGTLLNALLHHDAALAQLPRAGIVHRLDKDTSGLIVVARSLAAHTALVAMLSRHQVQRQYEALVHGALIAGGSVDAAIARHPVDRLRQAVRTDEQGKRALTHYRLRQRLRAHSVLECRLETGRTHQIRVHMAHIGHPLVGDLLYGGRPRLPRGASAALTATLQGFRRQALHAEKLAFSHPLSGQPMAFSAPRPQDMDALIAALQADADAAETSG